MQSPQTERPGTDQALMTPAGRESGADEAPIGRSDRPLLRVEDLRIHFPVRDRIRRRLLGTVKAVDGVSFDLHRGETLGVVGETGSGKSTLARGILLLRQPTSGRVFFADRELTRMSAGELRKARRQFQMVFQDPWGSLDPRMSVYDIVGEPLVAHGLAKGEELRRQVVELLTMCGLGARDALKYPHEFSGGQRQRVGIARALALRPQLVVADEPVSALDVSIQAQILNLLRDLQRELGLQYIFITHDLRVVRYVSNVVAVMYLGKIVERAERRALFSQPLHPYSKALLSASLDVELSLESVGTIQRPAARGDLPSPLNPPSGCRFRTRCPIAIEVCAEVEPPLEEKVPGRWVACHRVPVAATAEAAAEGTAAGLASDRAALGTAVAERTATDLPSQPRPVN
jgi:oligopeptide/dipeptide ABC transporter ATP-binding protein